MFINLLGDVTDRIEVIEAGRTSILSRSTRGREKRTAL